MCYLIIICCAPGHAAPWLSQVVVANRNRLYVILVGDLLPSNFWQFMSAGLVLRKADIL